MQQTHRPEDEIEDERSSLSVSDVDREEFFLSKNSTLFSQVSTNTLKTTPSEEIPADNEPGGSTHCQVVEVKEMEILKAIAGTNEDRVVLPRANFGVQQVPQVRRERLSGGCLLP